MVKSKKGKRKTGRGKGEVEEGKGSRLLTKQRKESQLSEFR